MLGDLSLLVADGVDGSRGEEASEAESNACPQAVALLLLGASSHVLGGQVEGWVDSGVAQGSLDEVANVVEEGSAVGGHSGVDVISKIALDLLEGLGVVANVLLDLLANVLGLLAPVLSDSGDFVWARTVPGDGNSLWHILTTLLEHDWADEISERLAIDEDGVKEQILSRLLGLALSLFCRAPPVRKSSFIFADDVFNGSA